VVGWSSVFSLSLQVVSIAISHVGDLCFCDGGRVSEGETTLSVNADSGTRVGDALCGNAAACGN